MTRDELVVSLRKLADFYELHNVEVPYIYGLNVFPRTKDDLVAIARALGKCEKGADDSFFYLKKTFGSIPLTFNLNRGEACRKVVVGKRTVPEKVIPEQVIAAHEEEIVEWHCEPVLKETDIPSLGAASVPF